jgi:diguanylate cyclase (GGDEF)-like protein
MLSLTMLAVILALGVWGWTLKTKVRRQRGELASLAFLERRRSRIFADINSSKPLAEILEAIAEMTSFMLNGAPCWCEVTDGARLGNYPPNAERLHTIHEEIPASTGPPLGTLCAGLDAKVFPGIPRTFAPEMEILARGAQLAMLAMETRRLHSELLRRSEVDLLTNVHNRRSLGERLDALIEEARQNASVFGLIYIDLDKFKPINDRYGHHVGDLFLQQVAERMKRQLRSADLLARMGGDEFAVLLPMVRHRTRVEEIALRLEHCFKEPFDVEGELLQGAASFGYSIYPEDGVTKESLLAAADAAMYLAKNIRKQAAAKKAGQEEPAPADRRRA